MQVQCARNLNRQGPDDKWKTSKVSTSVHKLRSWTPPSNLALALQSHCLLVWKAPMLTTALLLHHTTMASAMGVVLYIDL